MNRFSVNRASQPRKSIDRAVASTVLPSMKRPARMRSIPRAISQPVRRPLALVSAERFRHFRFQHLLQRGAREELEAARHVGEAGVGEQVSVEVDRLAALQPDADVLRTPGIDPGLAPVLQRRHRPRRSLALAGRAAARAPRPAFRVPRRGPRVPGLAPSSRRLFARSRRIDGCPHSGFGRLRREARPPRPPRHHRPARGRRHHDRGPGGAAAAHPVQRGGC